MPYNDEELDTQGTEVDVDGTNDADGNSDGGSDDQGNEPFLVVNDRQTYKTREEAIRGINEAGTRIAQLSAWEKELDRYGVKDPRVAAQLFDELLEARTKLAEAEKAAGKSSAQDQNKTQTDDEADLSKEDKAALAWLKKHAPRLGFVPKEELQSLKKEIEELKTSTAQDKEASQEQRRQSAVAEGRSAVASFLTTDKIDLAKQRTVETLIAAWINADDARVDRFHAGGSVQQALLKEGYEEAKKELGWGQSQQNNGTSTAVNKGKALVRNKTLPQAGAANRGSRQNDGVRKDAAGRKDHIGSVHDKAWEIASKHFSHTSAE